MHYQKELSKMHYQKAAAAPSPLGEGWPKAGVCRIVKQSSCVFGRIVKQAGIGVCRTVKQAGIKVCSTVKQSSFVLCRTVKTIELCLVSHCRTGGSQGIPHRLLKKVPLYACFLGVFMP